MSTPLCTSSRRAAQLLHRLANGLNDLDRIEAAIAMRQDCVAALEELEERSPGKRRPSLASACALLAALQAGAGAHEAGLAAAERCRAILGEPSFTASPEVRASIARCFAALRAEAPELYSTLSSGSLGALEL